MEVTGYCAAAAGFSKFNGDSDDDDVDDDVMPKRSLASRP